MVTKRYLEKIYNKLRIKIMLLMARGVLKAVNNDEKTQKVKIECLKDEVIDNVERLQEFGFESYAPVDDNTEVLTLFINGTRDIGLVIKAHNRELRPNDLEEGASCQYSRDSDGGNGNRITIKPTDNTIKIETIDNNIVTIDSNGIIIDDTNGNNFTLNSDGVNIECTNGNVIDMKSGEVEINGNLKVLQ